MSDKEKLQQLNAIKAALFNATEKNIENYLERKAIYGEFEESTHDSRIRFYACYSIIEECGLENEFEKWKRENGIDRR